MGGTFQYALEATMASAGGRPCEPVTPEIQMRRRFLGLIPAQLLSCALRNSADGHESAVF